MRLIKSFGYAFHGILHGFIKEANFRIHVVAGAIVTCCALLFHCSTTEWLVLLLNFGLVLSLELMNTALEKLCDLWSAGFNPQIKIIKDLAASAVLVAAICSAVSGLIIFVPKILFFFNTYNIHS